MTYAETLSYLYNNLPMFQRVGASAYKKDLTNTLQLCEVLGNPQRKFKSIHIAGTNGKGSTSHMLAAILQTAGYNTGLYTSPHLKEFTERIRVNGSEISQEFVVDFVKRIKPSIESIKPSFFEITVAMAFDYFAKEQTDIAVIETGLGGRLDSTNVIHPILSILTNISWDHMDLLGDTLPKIAFEKAGIIKEGVPVVVSERQDEVAHVFTDKANETKSKITFASDIYKLKKTSRGQYDLIKHNQPSMSIETDLTGGYQAKNIPGVLCAIDELRLGGLTISDEHLHQGLKNTITLTGLKGRWQTIEGSPLIICDTGHNEAGIKEILMQIKETEFDQLHWVLGMVRDKDVSKVLTLLPKDAKYYFCEASIPRAMSSSELMEKALGFGLVGKDCKNVNNALRQARNESGPNDLIFIGGSTYIVAEIENL
jgi:dihydrofolate synthase/folylpolyglutamate synthase